MKRIILCFLLFVCLAASGFSQTSFSGKVINAETREPLTGASAYLSNTSIAGQTNEKGVFHLAHIPSGKYKLVISFVGFEPYVMAISTNAIPSELMIALKPKVEEITSIVLDPLESAGWEKWGDFFLNTFIGTSSYSKDCVLQNSQVIKFRLNRKDSILYVKAREPIMIRNNSLGYSISYTLTEFTYDFFNKTLVYNGYPLFKDLSPEYPARAKKWKEKRNMVYTGSLMNFMRAFFSNKLTDEGFEIRSLATVFNQNKARAKYLFALKKDTVIERIIDTIWKTNEFKSFRRYLKTEDSTAFFKRALLQPDSIVSRELLSADSIGFAVDTLTAGMFAPMSLEITCLFKDVPREYKNLFPAHRFEKMPVSQFIFLSGKPVSILANGSYYGPHDLKVTGFWSWSETMATMLPYDFQPEK